MKRCGLYLRVSTDEQARNPEGSLKSQLQRIKEELKRRSDQDDSTWAVQKIYQDEGWSGKDTKRPDFQKMVKDAESGLLDVVLCTEISRVSRSTLDLLNFLKFLKEYDVEFVSVKQRDFDTTTSTGKVFMTLCAALAEFERDQVSERTSANMQARARRGLANGAIPFGYDRNPKKKGYLQPNEKRAPIVRLAFDLYLKLGSFKAVAGELNDSGYRAGGYISCNGRHHPERKFCLQTIQHMLTNKTYIGMKEIHKENIFKDQSKLPEHKRYATVGAVWSAIVPKEKFQEVQRLIQQNGRSNHNLARNVEHVFLLSKILKCEHCCEFLEGASGTGRAGKIYFYYRHYPASIRRPDCPLPKFIRAEALEGEVISKLGVIAENEDLLFQVAEEAARQTDERRPQLESQLAICRKKLLSLKGEANGLMSRMHDLPRTQIEEFVTPRLEEISDQRRQLENETAELEQSLGGIEKPDDILGHLRVFLKQFPALLTQLAPYKQREIIRGVVAKCILGANVLKLALKWGKRSNVVEVPVEMFKPVVYAKVAGG